MKVQTNMSWDVAWMYLQLQHFSQFREVGSSRLAQWRKTLECQTQFWLQVWSAIRLRLSAAWIDATRLPRVSKNPLYTVALSHVTTCMSADMSCIHVSRFWIGCVPLSVTSAVCRASMEWCGLSSDPDTEDVQPHSTPAGFCEDGNLAIIIIIIIIIIIRTKHSMRIYPKWNAASSVRTTTDVTEWTGKNQACVSCSCTILEIPHWWYLLLFPAR